MAIAVESRERGGALKIVLLVLGGLLVLVVGLALVGLMVLRHYVAVDVEHGPEGRKVEVSTPIGSFSVEKAEDTARKLNLPVYPGARATENSVSVKMKGELEGERGMVDVSAAEFVTDDDFEKVDAWYRQQLGPEFKRQVGHLSGKPGERIGERIEADVEERVKRRVEERLGRVINLDVRVRVEPGGNDVVYADERERRLRGIALERKLGRVRIGLFEVAQSGEQ
jgi:hypothetical protein